MREANTILELIQERGKKGLPLERVYRLLFNRNLYLMAYGKIYRNTGAMTLGITDETPDGMSLEKIETIIEALRYERYQWKPARRTYIPKKNGKKRPLGMPVWSDKLVQEVLRLILSAYFEPQFSTHSHGFRPERGCHTALREIYHNWTGVGWFIEGDISQCFDKLDHELLMHILAEHIKDGRFLHLIRELLDAGYLEDWAFHQTLSGVPQGGIVSPVLANVLLDKLDTYVETVLLPKYTTGTRRAGNPEYARLRTRAFYQQQIGNVQQAQKLKQQARTIPSILVNDPNYRRLRYIRYADDFLLGFNGPKSEAEEIKQAIRTFLQEELRLELSETKTLITHSRKEAARFLGYEITIRQADEKQTTTKAGGKRRSLNGTIGFRVPKEVVEEQCQSYMRHGKATHRHELEKESDYAIVTHYQLVYRGIVQYYRLAFNLHTLSKLRWIMEQSLTMTLAAKFKRSVSKIYEKYRADLVVNGKKYKGLRVVIPRPGKEPLVATWGDVPLIWDIQATLEEKPPRLYNAGHSELVQRLLAEVCELCGSTENIEVHHIRAMKHLHEHPGRPKPEWVKRMIALRRKTMILCQTCHVDIQNGRPLRRQPIKFEEVKAIQKKAMTTILESRVH